MKALEKFVLASILLLNLTTSLNAKNQQESHPSFEGVVKKNENQNSANDTLSIVYRKPHQPYGTRENEFKVISDKYGRFSFQLPGFADPLEMRIYLRYKDISGKKSERVGAKFLVEQNDKISIVLMKTGRHSSDSATFFGQGVNKYNMANLLEKLCSNDRASGQFRDSFRKIFTSSTGNLDISNLEYKMALYCKVTAQISKYKAELISKSELSPKMKKLISYNNAPIFEDWIAMMSSLFVKLKDDPNLSSIIKKNYDENKNKFNYSYDSLMGFCPRYLTGLANSEYAKMIIDHNGRKIEFLNFYNAFRIKHSGPVREFLIASLFCYGTGWRGKEPVLPQLMDSLMRDGEKYITIPIIKSAYNAKLKLSKGSNIFNGVFDDINGKNMSISQLKGKVVLIDLWFTGCGQCANFNQSFHKICYPYLAGNSDFVYLSISLDKQKDKWFRGIKSGQYSSVSYMNVNAQLGWDHPFIKYYEKSSFPFLIIVDRNGKIYETRFANYEDIKNKIIEALDESHFTNKTSLKYK